jgi:predicted ATPase
MSRSLPTTPTSFVGRRRELELLAASFARGSRLVTLLGSPGIGKSRLALWYAAEALERGVFARVVVCELAEAESLGDLCAALGRALGRGPGGGDRVGAIAAQLSALERVLVVLDDVDRIAAVAAKAMARWVRQAPGVRFVVTSRIGLRLAAETLLSLGPLSLPASDEDIEASEAVQLFVARARQVRPDYRLGAEAPEVAAIVRALDGIPLAIELAASRMGVLDAAQLRGALRLDILTTMADDARHATLRDAIEVSFCLLDPQERRTMIEISVFRGGFDLEAAARVVAHPSEVALIDSLQGLVTKSLLFVRTPVMRFDAFASIREHAETLLAASGEREAVLDRHARHFLDKLAAAPPPWVERERDNLLAAHATLIAGDRPSAEQVEGALAIALALEPILTRWGPPHTALGLLEDALAAGRAAPAMRRRALVARARALHASGRPSDSRMAFESALAIARRDRDEAATAAAAAGLGELLREMGDLAGAERHLRAALPSLARGGDHVREIAAQIALGHTLLVAGRPDEARSHYEAGLRLAEHDPAARGGAEVGLGVAALATCRLDECDEILERARMRGALPPHLEEVRLVHLSMLRQEQQRVAEALAAAESARSLSRMLGLTRAQGRSLVQLGMVCLEQGDLEQACEALGQGTRLLREGGDVRADVVFSAALAAAEARRGAMAEARRIFRWVDEQLAEAAARTAGDADPIEAVVEVYRAVVAAKPPPSPESRAAARSHHLRAALRVAGAGGASAGEAGALVVSSDGRWCRLPDGREIRFARGRAQRLMLLRLVEERLVAPGRALPLAALFEHGWPGERAVGETFHNRVHVSLSRLRKRGLAGVMVSRDDGFLIDPAVPTFRADPPSAVR